VALPIHLDTPLNTPLCCQKPHHCLLAGRTRAFGKLLQHTRITRDGYGTAWPAGPAAAWEYGFYLLRRRSL
jgi:hypothetical protein